LTGFTAETVAFGTEAPYLKQIGMDVVVLGPGDIAQAHQPDEFLALDRIGPTVGMIRELIGRFCVSATESD
jgi:acetylornithine deacetylase